MNLTEGESGAPTHPSDEGNKARDIVPCIGCWVYIDFGLAINQTISLSLRRRRGMFCSGATDLDHRFNLEED